MARVSITSGHDVFFLLFSDWAGFEYRGLRREGKIKERA